MELVQTIQMMKSEDYHERFKAEYFQLKIRHDRLVEMVEKYKAGTLEFTPNCPMEVYKLQLEAMEKYLDVLVIRAKIEGIELVEPKIEKINKNKKKFKLEDYPGNYAMHCKHPNEAKVFCDYLHNHGEKWRDGDSYSGHTYWYEYCVDTVYAFNEGFFGRYKTLDDCNYAVLEFDDFDWTEKVESKSKPKFSFADYPENYAMHCHSEEQSQVFYNALEKHFGEPYGFVVSETSPYFRWGRGDKFFSGDYGSSAVGYNDHGFTTLEFDDFDWTNN